MSFTSFLLFMLISTTNLGLGFFVAKYLHAQPKPPVEEGGEHKTEAHAEHQPEAKPAAAKAHH